MRPLTLDEKISVKGVLSRYDGFTDLASLDMEEAVKLFSHCTGRSIKYYYIYPLAPERKH